MTNQSIFTRLNQMFSAPQYECDDPLRELLFRYTVSFVESKRYTDTDWTAIKNGNATKDFLSNVYTYITRDRPLNVNMIIEQQLLGNHDAYDKATISLKTTDSHYMKSIIDGRGYIFN